MPKQFAPRSRDSRVLRARERPAESIYPECVNELRQAVYWTLEEPDASSDISRVLTMGVASVNVFMIVLSLVSMIIETDPTIKENTPGAEAVWKSIEIISTACFTLEYVLRFWVSDVYGASAVDWFFKPMNICDLLAIVPVYVELFVPDWDMKVLRVLRVVRLFKIGRYSQGVRVMNAALSNSLSALYILTFLFAICSVIFASILYFSEKLSCPDFSSLDITDFQIYNEECELTNAGVSESYGTCCAYMCDNMPGGASSFSLCKALWREETAIKLGRLLASSSSWQVEAMHELEIDSVLTGMWWAAVTMTTVGYGDIVPKNWVSKLVSSVAMLTGMLIIAMPFAIVGTKFSEAAIDCAEDKLDLPEEEEGELASSPSGAGTMSMPVPQTPASVESADTALASGSSKAAYAEGVAEALEKLHQEVHSSLKLKQDIMKTQMLRDNLWTSVEHSMVVLAFEGSISFSADMINGPWIKAEQPMRTKSLANVEYPYCTWSLGYIHRDYMIRRMAVAITGHSIFESFVLFLIVANSVILALQNYYYDQENHWGNVLQRESENAFTILFTVECAMKIVAHGFVAHPKTYLRDPWNWIDFTVVVAGLLTAMQVSAFSFLRSVRVLRPLRSLSAVPGIRNLFRTIILSMPGLKDVVLLACFLMVMFGVLGLHFWSGLLHRSCRLVSQPLHFSPLATSADCAGWCFDNSSVVNVSLGTSWKLISSAPVFDSFCRTSKTCLKAWESGQDYYLWPMDYNQERFCGEYKCRALSLGDLDESIDQQVLKDLGSLPTGSSEVETFCGSPLASDPEYAPEVANAALKDLNLDNWHDEVDGEGRNFGLTNFDNVGAAFLVVFQSVTLEGWTDIMRMVQDAYSISLGFIYFMLLVLIGSFFLINVILAIIWDAFCGVEEANKKRLEEEEAAAAELLAMEASPVDAPDTSASQEKRTSVMSVKDASRASGLACKDALRQLVFKRGKTDTDALMLDHSDYAVARLARKIGSNRYFNAFIMSLIIINIIVLAMDGYPSHLLDQEVGKVLNYIFNTVFLLEFVILHLAVGPLVYWSDNAMAFDGLIVVISVADIANDIASGAENSGSAITALRAFRMLRIIKLAKKFPSMKILLSAGVKTLMSMGDFTALLFLIICVFALVAQSFFGGTLMFDPDTGSLVPPEEYREKCPFGDGSKPVCVPRAHFDTFLWSFVTIFQILTGENWNTVMYDAMRATHWTALWYFLFVVVFGNFVILNLFLAILMTNFDEQRTQMADELEAEKSAKSDKEFLDELDSEESQESEQKVLPGVEDAGATEGKKRAWEDDVEVVDAADPGEKPLSIVPSSPASPPADKAGSKRQLSKDGALRKQLTKWRLMQEDGSTDISCGLSKLCGSKSFCLFSKDGPIRSLCVALVKDSRFDTGIMVLIGISSLLMAFENPLQDPNGSFVKAMQVVGTIFTAVFFLELIVKMIALGVLCSYDPEQPAYLRSFENIMDFVIVCVSMMDTIQTLFFPDSAGGGVIGVMKIFRGIRMLRPLRLISRNKNLKVVVKTLTASLPELRDLLVFSSLFFLIFALIFVSIYKGSFHSCQDSGLEGHEFTGTNMTPMCIPGDSVTLPGRPAAESLKVMQQRPEDAESCQTGWESWQRPSESTPVCEVHCDGQGASQHLFCQNTSMPWGYHVMRCTDCQAAFCKEDAATRSGCQNSCRNHEYFCKGKHQDQTAIDACLEQCVASCMCGDSCVGLIQDAALCVEQGGKWVNMNQNFDSLFMGMVSLFEICTTEGWVDVMLAAVDSRGPYIEPRRDENEFVGSTLFMAFMLVGSFFVLNLCVGVIIDNYNKQKEQTGTVMVSDAQRDWMDYQKALYLKKTFFTQVNVDRLGPSRQHRFRIITSAVFEHTIMGCIVMNTITLMMVWQPRPTGSLESALGACNTAFALVFHFELFMKLSALHWNYFREYWNVFDFLCVFTSDIIAVVETWSSGDSNVNLSSLVNSLRIFRVARLFRLVRFLKGLNKLILAFALSVPKLLNVGLVMVLLLYLYAVLGVSLFAKVAYTGVGVYSETTHFRTFFGACTLLIRSMTGEGFNEIMHDLSKGPFYYQSILGIKCEEQDFSAPFSTLDLDGDGLVDNPTECGTPLAFIYFITYTVLVSFVILNLFIAVIFEGFEESSGSETKEVINKCLENWERYDPYNTMHVPMTKALDFVDETVEELMGPQHHRKGGRVPESRWDPNSTTDMNASDAMWSMYNLHYVRTLGLKVRPDGKVRLVQAVKAVIRRLLISGGPYGQFLIRAERRQRVAVLENLEMMILDAKEDKEPDMVELRRLELAQSRSIAQTLGRDMSAMQALSRASHFVGDATGVSGHQKDDRPGEEAQEFSLLEKVAAAKIQRRAKESLQRRRDRAKGPETAASSGWNAAGPITRAAG
eukprot:gb/GFBE01080540.1/.p1 GENE.gb/GFBE01080540.1/~~gb/GFBE01080540.1/.p1  ORF type:complete len:2396 (+),score=576.99 gb/GFBE01080540.1/:1-7188(+)